MELTDAIGLVEKVIAVAQRFLCVLVDRNGDRLDVLVAVALSCGLQCQALAKEYKDLAQEPDIPADQAAQLNKIVRSFKSLATELDMLAANMRDGKRSLQCAHSERPPRSTG